MARAFFYVIPMILAGVGIARGGEVPSPEVRGGAAVAEASPASPVSRETGDAATKAVAPAPTIHDTIDIQKNTTTTVEGRPVAAADQARLNAVLADAGSGFRLTSLEKPPAAAVLPAKDTAGDFRPPRYFVIERPVDKPFKLGRVWASCTCLKAEAAGPVIFKAGQTGAAVVRLRFLHTPPADSESFMIVAQLLEPEEDMLMTLVNPRE